MRQFHHNKVLNIILGGVVFGLGTLALVGILGISYLMIFEGVRVSLPLGG